LDFHQLSHNTFARRTLTKKVILPGAGHWIQQERPTEVNALLVEFLKSV
jgi:pimeloyl-ACP methyl ester carboxylesterase